MNTYRLAHTAYMCVVGRTAIFLDLKQNRYVGIGPPEFDVLLHSLEGTSETDVKYDVSMPRRSSADAKRLYHCLRSHGLLADDHENGKRWSRATIEMPAGALVKTIHEDALLGSGQSQSQIQPAFAMHFAAATLMTALRLQFLSLHQIVNRIIEAKSQHGGLSSASRSADTSALVVAARWTRPFLYGCSDRCLFDSLTLVEFLGRFGVFPTIVFGVRTHPFAAHCWVQDGAMVFNDYPEHARSFTPIMVI